MKSLSAAILFSFLILTGCVSSKTGIASDTLQYHHFSEVSSLMEDEPRPIAVFLHADWCKYCKNMEQTTFRDPAVVNLLNHKYYYISFNGEQKDDISFRGRIYKYHPSGRNTGTHDLAFALAGAEDGSLVYPSFVMLNQDYEIVFQNNSFLNGQQMEIILTEGVILKH